MAIFSKFTLLEKKNVSSEDIFSNFKEILPLTSDSSKSYMHSKVNQKYLESMAIL